MSRISPKRIVQEMRARICAQIISAGADPALVLVQPLRTRGTGRNAHFEVRAIVVSRGGPVCMNAVLGLVGEPGSDVAPDMQHEALTREEAKALYKIVLQELRKKFRVVKVYATDDAFRADAADAFGLFRASAGNVRNRRQQRKGPAKRIRDKKLPRVDAARSAADGTR